MLKKEKRFLFILSIVLFIVSVTMVTAITVAQIQLWVFSLLPLAMIIFYIMDQMDNRRIAVKEAVYSCIEESEMDAIHNIEFLREYFADIDDLSRFLTLVDSRVISYVFDKDNINLKFKDYIMGGVHCLSHFKSYKGGFDFKLDKVSAEPGDKVGLLLCTLYRISLELTSGCKQICVVLKQSRNRVAIKVNSEEKTKEPDEIVFAEKILKLFSSRNLLLTSGF